MWSNRCIITEDLRFLSVALLKIQVFCEFMLCSLINSEAVHGDLLLGLLNPEDEDTIVLQSAGHWLPINTV